MCWVIKIVDTKIVTISVYSSNTWKLVSGSKKAQLYNYVGLI